MYNHNKAQQSKNRVHISWDILYHGYQPIATRFVPMLTIMFIDNHYQQPLKVLNVYEFLWLHLF